jgi:aromatic-L-amino-acid/L-tryptophan decarboxylase
MTDLLDPDRPGRDELTALVAGFLGDWYDRIPDMDATGADLTPEELQSLQAHPGETGRDLVELLGEIDMAGQAGILHPAGGHMSYIPNGGLYTGALGDFLATALNRYTGVAGAAPGFSAIEHGVVDWMASLFGLGHSASGLLLSGGSMANFTGVVTARTARLGDDIRNGVIYVSPHTHHSVAKSARLAGFRADQIIAIQVDDGLRMDSASLDAQVKEDLAAGRRPFMVVASAGTTDTGTVDPLVELASVAADNSLWMHVDGAYGGFFQLTARGNERLTGIERADSIALDPHKGLSIPFGVGALVVRDEGALVDAHQGRGAYLKDEDNYMGVRDIASLGPELSRPFRGLSVWLPLQLHGVAPFREALDRSLDLAEHAFRRFSGIDGIDPFRPDLSIVAVRFRDDEIGKAAMDAVNSDGTAHISHTIVDGRFVLRLAILNRRTTIEHVDHTIDIIEKTLVG